MHNIKLTNGLRAVSILIIFLLGFLFFRLNTLKKYIITESSKRQLRNRYEHDISFSDNRSPEFTYNLESLFPRQLTPMIVETKIVSKPIVDVTL